MVNYYEGKLEDLFNKDTKYCFLVGAGASMDPPASIPSAREMGKMLLEFCAVKDEVEKLLKLPALRFEMIVEEIQSWFDSDLRFLDYFDRITHPNLIHLFLANMIVAGHSVITTNFDYCIELALLTTVGDAQKDMIFPIITKDDYLKFETNDESIKNRLVITKIHGSKKNIITDVSTSESLVITTKALGKDREVGKTFAIEPYKKRTVEKLTMNRTLVVMGYSGSDDFDINPLLQELSKLSGIIWIEHNSNPSNNEDSNRNDFILSLIEKNGGFPVTLLRINTIQLVEKKLWRYLLPERLVVPLINISAFSKLPQFQEFIYPIFENNSELKKYQLTEKLYIKLYQIEAIVQICQIGLNLAQKAHNKIIESHFFNELTIINISKGNYDTAQRYSRDALRISDEINDFKGKATAYINIGLIYHALKDYNNALKNYTESLRIAENLGDLGRKASCLNNIGSIYEIKGDYDNALKNYTEALKIDELLGNLSSKSIHLNNICLIYKNKGDYDSSLKIMEEVLKINKNLGTQQDVENNLAEIRSLKEIIEWKKKTEEIQKRLPADPWGRSK